MKLALWLLKTFGVPQRNESLLGDLIEERAAGRSLLWLWTQTLAALADAVIRDLRQHWLLALRAVGLGWATSYSFAHIWAPTASHVWWWGFQQYIHPWGPPLDFLLRCLDVALNFLIWPVALGYIVAGTHRTKQASMILAFTVSVALAAPWVLIQNIPPDDWLEPSLALAFSAIFGVLLGGFLANRSHKNRNLSSTS